MIFQNKAAIALAALTLGVVPSVAVAEAHVMGYEIGNVDDLEFGPFGDSPIEMAVLWGDPSTGPSGLLLRIPVGYQNVPHSHTANYRAIIIEGTGLHWTEDGSMETAVPVTSGGYWFQPGGQLHTDANGGDTPGLALIVFDGPLDMMVPE